MILVCYEVNGVFMVGIMGCFLGWVGVILVILGFGCGNFVIGVVIVNFEGDLMIVIGGVVKCDY